MPELDRGSPSRLRSLVRSGGHFIAEVTGLGTGPLPVARALRNGVSIATGFTGLALTGHLKSAVICAIFINLLIFVDQLGPVRERLWVLAIAALCFASAGAIGELVAGTQPVVFLATFAFASFVGLVQGSVPGVELIPRNSLICMVIGAYLPPFARRHYSASDAAHSWLSSAPIVNIVFSRISAAPCSHPRAKWSLIKTRALWAFTVLPPSAAWRSVMSSGTSNLIG